jgi:hypothetical protein
MAIKNYQDIDTTLDVTTTRTLLHEAIPLTGTIYFYQTGAYVESNIKNYTHGMFQSVYDYPYLSSSANHIFDISVGYAGTSKLSASTSVQNAKKINMYTEFAQTLLGYTGSLVDPAREVRFFEKDLSLDGVGKMRECFFFNFSRLLAKDQIKKGSYSMTIGTGSWKNPFKNVARKGITVTDASSSADGSGITNTLGGDMGVLYSDKNFGHRPTAGGATMKHPCGAIFYQAGIVVLTGSLFSGSHGTGTPVRNKGPFYYAPHGQKYRTITETLTSSAISAACDAIRHRVGNISFNNTTEINSKIYFCRVPHNMFNYSANPTYLTGSKIRVKNNASDSPVAYITTVGLYNSSNELLAVAKLSEPIRKDPTNDITIRVRLDY